MGGSRAMLMGALMAGAGGLLPTLARLAASFASDLNQPLPQWHILIALAIFFVLGVVIDLAVNRGSDLRQAVIIGIAAPGLITNIVAGAATVSVPATQPAATPRFAPASVPLGLGAVSNRRTLVVRASVDGAANGPSVELTIGAVMPQPAHTTVLGTAMPGEDARFALPPGTTAITATAAGRTATTTLPPAGDVALRATVRVGPTGQGDLFWALGGPRKSTVTAIDLAPTAVPD